MKTTIEGSGSRRPDFLMISVEGRIEIVEIKRPTHAMNADEYGRLYGYVETVGKYLDTNRGIRQTLFRSPRHPDL